MHELPKELGNSLRSFRNSVHRHNAEPDIEKAIDGEGAKRPHQTSSSLILHPTFSRQALGLNIPTHDEGPQKADQQPVQHALSHHSSKHTHHRWAPETPAGAKRPLLTAPKIADPDPAADRLDDDEKPLAEEDFYKLMGMKPPVSKTENPKKLGMKNGMYTRIVAKYDYINMKYRIFDVLTYVLLVLQLLLGAVFVVLGSIAVLGALSTVTAGALALMKGQGLPNRLHQMRDDLHNVKFEAEELYWDVAAGRTVLYRDIRKLREDYLRVMEDGRRNHPDTWNAAAQQVAAGVHTLAGKEKAGAIPGAVPIKLG